MGAFGCGGLPVFFTILTNRHRLCRWLLSWLCRCFGWLCRLRLYRLHWLLYLLWCNFRWLLNRWGSSLYRCRCFSGGFLYWCCFGLLWCNVAHNLINEFVFMVVLYLAVHEILDDVSVCVGNKTAVLIAHTSHHHCRFLAAVLVADSQLHVGCIVGWRTCHTSVCLWLCWC